ncbi:MAG: glycosyltransferase family 4 protein [Proteobacteria bacterium]|nr:glycosyltransferase family 4 protein [Pseudomonadota bacterium]
MKILVLCLSPDKGGLELYVGKVMRWLAASGIGCYVVVAPSGILEAKAKESAIPYQTLKCLSTLLPLLAAKRLARVIDEEAIDIIHVHWGKDLTLAVLAKSMARKDVKLIYSRHMGITRTKKDVFHRWQYAHVHKMIVFTRLLFDEARRYLPLPQDGIELLYHGVADCDVLASKSCRDFMREIGLEQRRFRVGLFGRIEFYKGQHVLVEAIEKLVGEGMDVGAAMIGHPMDDSYFDRLKESIRSRGLVEHIRTCDFVEDAMAIMRCFDVIVLTTYAETFGLVLVEAMRVGTPVIGTNACGVPEIIEDGVTGLLFEPGDSAGLARAISSLYSGPEVAAQLAAAAKKMANERFSEEKHYRRLRQIFNSVHENT